METHSLYVHAQRRRACTCMHGDEELVRALNSCKLTVFPGVPLEPGTPASPTSPFSPGWPCGTNIVIAMVTKLVLLWKLLKCDSRVIQVFLLSPQYLLGQEDHPDPVCGEGMERGGEGKGGEWRGGEGRGGEGKGGEGREWEGRGGNGRGGEGRGWEGEGEERRGEGRGGEGMGGGKLGPSWRSKIMTVCYAHVFPWQSSCSWYTGGARFPGVSGRSLRKQRQYKL